MREIVHVQAGQCGNQIGAKVRSKLETEYVYAVCNIARGRVYACLTKLRLNLKFGCEYGEQFYSLPFTMFMSHM